MQNGKATGNQDTATEELRTIRDAAALALAAGRSPQDAATLYGIAPAALHAWLADDTAFKAAIESYRQKFIAVSQTQLYSRLLGDSATNLESIIEIRENTALPASVRLSAAKTLLKAAMEGMPSDHLNSGTVVVNLPSSTIKTFVEALAHFHDKDPEAITAEYHLPSLDKAEAADE